MLLVESSFFGMLVYHVNAGHITSGKDDSGLHFAERGENTVFTFIDCICIIGEEVNPLVFILFITAYPVVGGIPDVTLGVL